MERILLRTRRAVDDDLLGVDVGDGALAAGDRDVAGVDGGAALDAGTDHRRIGDEQGHRLALHVRAHQRPVGVVVLEERDHRRGHRPDLLRRDVDEIDLPGPDGDVLTGLGAAEDLVAGEVPVVIDRRVRLGDDLLLLLVGVDADHLAGELAVLHHPVGGGDEAVLGDLRVGGQRADETDVRTLGGLDRAHAAIVGRVDVADLDRRPLAGEPAGAERGQPPAMGEPAQRVRLVHELRQLGASEELLERRHDRTDVDDRLWGDGVGILGGEALADDALHPVEADAERLLDELTDRAQPPVAEVLVLVEVLLDRLPRHRDRLGRVILHLGLGLLGHAEQARQ